MYTDKIITYSIIFQIKWEKLIYHKHNGSFYNMNEKRIGIQILIM